MPLLQLLLEGLEESRRERRGSIIVGNRGARGAGKVGSHRHVRGPIHMTKYPRPIEDASDRELPENVVGTIKHRIRMV